MTAWSRPGGLALSVHHEMLPSMILKNAHEPYIRAVIANLSTKRRTSFGEWNIGTEMPRNAWIQIDPTIYYGSESLEAFWSEEQGWWLVVTVDKGSDDPSEWLNYMEAGVLPSPEDVAAWIEDQSWKEGMPPFGNRETHYRKSNPADAGFEQELARIASQESSSGV